MRWRGGRGFTIDWLSNGQGWGTGALRVGAIADGLRLESQDSQSLFPGLGLSSRGAVYTWRDGRTCAREALGPSGRRVHVEGRKDVRGYTRTVQVREERVATPLKNPPELC